jgi:MscS family membrane protein
VIRKPIAVLSCCIFWLAAWLLPASASAEDLARSPLSPPDISTPTATLDTFMTEIRAAARAYRAGDLGLMRVHAERAFQTFALELPRTQSGFVQGAEVALDLFEVLIRVDLPPVDALPGGDPALQDADAATALPASWRIPETEIRLVRELDEADELIGYKFSGDTLARAREFRRHAEDLPVKPEFLTYRGIAERFNIGPGLAAPAAVVATVNALPEPALTLVGGQPIWKWLTLTLGLVIAGLIFLGGYRLAALLEGGSENRPKRAAWARPLILASLIMAVGFMQFVVVDIIRLTGPQLTIANGLLAVLGHLTAIWLIFQLAVRAAGAVVAVRDMRLQSLDAQLLLLVAKVAALFLSLVVLLRLADSLSIPLAPMLAGLGVGGLAVALAVRPTLENAVGGFVLFADKPVKVGEFCAFGDKLGTVEAVGLRSVQVRGLDRTLITIPNAQFCDLQITNFSRRDSNLFQTTLGLRYETSADQLRLVLVRLRELLIRHPMVAIDPARVRFAGFGDFALNVEIFAFVNTRDWNEFLAVQEDLNLRIKGIVEAAGTGFAFPSQTLYMERGQGLVPEEIEKAASMVRRWREENRLPPSPSTRRASASSSRTCSTGRPRARPAIATSGPCSGQRSSGAGGTGPPAAAAQRTAMAAISILTSLGRRAAWTVARAGGFSGKKVA